MRGASLATYYADVERFIGVYVGTDVNGQSTWREQGAGYHLDDFLRGYHQTWDIGFHLDNPQRGYRPTWEYAASGITYQRAGNGLTYQYAASGLTYETQAAAALERRCSELAAPTTANNTERHRERQLPRPGHRHARQLDH